MLSYNGKIGYRITKENGKLFKNRAYGNWKCSTCGKIFRTRKDMYSHVKSEHPIKTGSSWNKGLTKDDPRVKKYLDTIQRKIKSGEIIPWNRGKKMTEE